MNVSSLLGFGLMQGIFGERPSIEAFDKECQGFIARSQSPPGDLDLCIGSDQGEVLLGDLCGE